MSSPLAIAAVTAVLRDLLNNGVIQHDLTAAVGVVRVTARPPDTITAGPNEAPQLNLYLYQVTPNLGWRNVAQPARDAAGSRVANPPLALDLHYLLSAYGGDDFAAEILLGYALHLLHETPVLSRDAIRQALGPPSPVTGAQLPPAFMALVAADLADQVEQIKLTPEALSTEELSRLWPAFGAHHRPSAAYRASVVLIESRRSTRAALPVLKVKSYVMPLVRPQIASVGSAALPPADPRLTAAGTVAITGSNLRGAGSPSAVRVRLGEAFVPAPSLTVTAERITFPLAGIAGLRAGVLGVQVVHEVLMGEPAPGVPHRGVESNAAAFILHPLITAPASVPAAAGTLAVVFSPAVGKVQRVTLYLYEMDAPEDRPARAYSFPAPRDNGIIGPATETAAIDFPFSSVAPGDYLLTAQVDGAESLLSVDGTGKFAGPKVTIT